jgi:hypothetical protein
MRIEPEVVSALKWADTYGAGPVVQLLSESSSPSIARYRPPPTAIAARITMRNPPPASSLVLAVEVLARTDFETDRLTGAALAATGAATRARPADAIARDLINIIVSNGLWRSSSQVHYDQLFTKG